MVNYSYSKAAGARGKADSLSTATDLPCRDSLMYAPKAFCHYIAITPADPDLGTMKTRSEYTK